MDKVKLAEKLSDIDSSDAENKKQNRQNRAKKIIESDDEYEENSRCMLPAPPKKPALVSMKKSSNYFQEKNPSKKHSTLSNHQQKENCSPVGVSLSSLSCNIKQKMTTFDNTEFVQKISKRPIDESRTLNVDICNSTISNDMGKTLSHKKPYHYNNKKLSFLYFIVLINFDLY